MQQRRPGFLSRVAGAVNRLVGNLFGGAPEEEAPPSAPPETPVEEYPEQPEPVPPEYQGPAEQYPPEDQFPQRPGGMAEEDASYIPREGRNLGRWDISAGGAEMDIDSARNLLNAAGYKNTYAIIIHGVPENPYPGKEGEYDIWLSYGIEGGTAWDALDDPGVRSAQDWVNDLVSDFAYGNGWNTIYNIQIVDR